MGDNELYSNEVPEGLVVACGKLEKQAAAQAAGECGMGPYSGARAVPTHDQLAQLAYCRYEARGRKDGHAIEDWLAAERELFHHYA